MSRTSIPNRALSAAAALVVFSALLSPANATTAADLSDGSISAAKNRAPTVLTSRSPWLAPVGHRQPRRADVPQHEAVSAGEQQQRQLDRELDRKLIICRGC